MLRPAALALLLALAARPVHAQSPSNNPEGIQIGLSTDVVRINAGFSGADLTIFGSLDHVDTTLTRQPRYDVIVVLEGPGRRVVVRKKQRVLGIWMNTSSEEFVNVPESYSLATTRALTEIAPPATYATLSVGPPNIRFQPAESGVETDMTADFSAALRERKTALGFYSQRIGGVQFLSPTLFRAIVPLPPDVPVGTHRARAFLFKDGAYVRETAAPLLILKSGFEQMLYRQAHSHSVLFGFFAVALASVTGWLGRLIFRRD